LGANTASSSSGQGLVDVLLGLLLSNLFGKVINNDTQPSTGPAGPLTGAVLTPGKEVLGFYAEWWATDTSSFTSYSKNADVVKTIAPFWATINGDGTVSDRGGNDHPSVVKFAHQNNGTVLLMVNNAKQSDNDIHQVLASPELRSKTITNLAAYLKKYDLDGINIDFEMVQAKDRDNLTAFMRELASSLKPQGYIISIDVFPKQDESNDVSIAYDYAQLAHIADKIMIMTYDNHGVWSKAGPVADIQWVENNLKYALRFIPSQKIYLGVAAYGYDWSTKGVESLEYSGVMNLANRFGSTIQWDEPSKSPHFNYIGPDGVKHEVWFENSKSLTYKLDLINKYNLAGAAMWKLGQEDPSSWQVARQKLSQ
jgi:spore germination protein YaaH